MMAIKWFKWFTVASQGLYYVTAHENRFEP
jgi:hypothetical protein